MGTVDTLEKTESAVAALSDSDKKKLFRKLARSMDGTPGGISSNPNIMGGAACIRDTRIPVWLLYRARQLNVAEADLLRSYPGLTAEDLVNAWDYAAMNRDEIELQIKENEADD